MQRKEKIGIGLAYFMQFLMLALVFIALIHKDVVGVINGLGALVVTFLPLMLRRKWRVTLPWTLNLLIVFSLYLHSAGMILGWYMTIPFYDKFGHFVGSLSVALLGFTLEIIFEKYSQTKINKRHVILFIILFTMALGAIWEITEFSVDKIFGTMGQHGLDDTMWDLICDLFGAIVLALIVDIRFRVMEYSVLRKNRVS